MHAQKAEFHPETGKAALSWRAAKKSQHKAHDVFGLPVRMARDVRNVACQVVPYGIRKRSAPRLSLSPLVMQKGRRTRAAFLFGTRTG
jgi:hypothetical protein